MPDFIDKAAENVADFEEAWDQYTQPGQSDRFLRELSEKLARRSGANSEAESATGKVLAGLYGELAEVAGAADSGLERSLREEDLAEEVACCVLEGVYAMLTAVHPQWARTAGEWRREVERSKVVAVLEAIRASLSAAMIGSRRGRAGWSVGILGVGLSGTIRKGMDMVVLGPTMVMMTEAERVVQSVGDRAPLWLSSARCEPILHIWNAVTQWYYGETGGFFRKARGKILSVFSEIGQTLTGIDRSIGQSVTESAFGTSGIKAVRSVIDAIDIILGSLDLLRRCRIRGRGRRRRDPRPRPGEGDDRRDRGDRGRTPRPGREESPDDRRRSGGGEDPSVVEPSGEEPERTGGSRRSTSSRARQVPEGFERREDEVIGEMIVASRESSDMLFLTPANMALLARQAGASPEVQRRALEGDCRDNLNDDTIEALRSAGVQL